MIASWRGPVRSDRSARVSSTDALIGIAGTTRDRRLKFDAVAFGVNTGCFFGSGAEIESLIG